MGVDQRNHPFAPGLFPGRMGSAVWRVGRRSAGGGYAPCRARERGEGSERERERESERVSERERERARGVAAVLQKYSSLPEE